MGIPDGEAYWRRHYGIRGRWTPTPRGRRGCIWLLAAAFVVMLAVLVFGSVVAAT